MLITCARQVAATEELVNNERVVHHGGFAFKFRDPSIGAFMLPISRFTTAPNTVFEEQEMTCQIIQELAELIANKDNQARVGAKAPWVGTVDHVDVRPDVEILFKKP